MTEIIQLAKLKIFSIWPFIEKKKILTLALDQHRPIEI